MQLPPAITSRTNAKVKALRAALSGKASKTGDLLGIEGEHLIQEAHFAGLDFDTVYLREGNESFLDVPDDLPRVQGNAHRVGAWHKELRAAQWVVLSRDVFDSAVTTVTPQGVAATWVIREPGRGKGRPCNALVLENVQDPGNLGTLIRSAEAFGVSQVMVTPGAANHWNPKVVRSAAGSLFRTPVTRMPIEEIARTLRENGFRIFAAVSSFTGVHNIAARHGVLTGRLANADAPEELRYGFPQTSDGYAASLSYDTDFEHPFAILVGNEGNGLSEKALSLADEQVQIPGGGVESLNAAVAGSILMYEAMRQIPLRIWAKKQGLRK